MLKKFLALMLALTMVLCAAAAAAEETTAETAEAAAETTETAADTAAEVPDTLLVIVNGQEIRENDENLQFWKNYLNESSGVDPEEYKELIQQYAMNYTLNYAIIAQKLAEQGKTVTREEAEARLQQEWEDYVKEVMVGVTGVGDDATDEEKQQAREYALQYIEMYTGYTEENFLKELPMGYVLIMNEQMEELIADKTGVTEEDIQAYFDSLVKEDQEAYGDDAATYEFYTLYNGQPSYYTPEGYRAVVHILLPVEEELMNTWKDLTARLEEQEIAANTDTEETTEETPADDTSAETTPEPTETPEPVTQEMVDAAEKAILDSVQAKVDEIKQKLADGAAFEDLIKEYGTDPGMEDDATRAEGYKVHKDSIMWDPAFTAAAMALEKVGDVGEPVVGQNGVHILQYLKDVPGGAVELTDELKEELSATLKNEKINTAIDELTTPWMEEAEIVWTDEGLAWKIPDEEAADTAD